MIGHIKSGQYLKNIARAISKKYCPGNIKKILPSSQSAWNTRFYFGHQELCIDNNNIYSNQDSSKFKKRIYLLLTDEVYEK